MTLSGSTPDDDMLMAYADGELDPLTAKRMERAIAADPALAETVAAHRALRLRLGAAFAPVLEAAVPDHLAAMLETNVVAITPRAMPVPQPRHWLSGLAVAASLVVGVALGTQWQGPTGPVSASGSSLMASGNLARALDTQLASTSGDTRILVSFRVAGGGYCRVFAAPALDGIACRSGATWELRQTQASGARRDAAYRQAASDDRTFGAPRDTVPTGDAHEAPSPTVLRHLRQGRVDERAVRSGGGVS